MLAYLASAFLAGWVLSIALANLAPAWPRFLVHAVVSTLIGMIVSRLLTDRVFPSRSGRVIVAAFAGVTIATIALGWAGSARPPSWLQAFQSVLLVGLAFGLFPARQTPEPD